MKTETISLTERFIMLSRLFMQKHHQMGANHLHDPYRGQGRILSLLKMQPEMSQKQLSYLLGIRPQSMGELLTKLEQNGYIARTPSAEDKRAMDIRLTDEGAKVAAENEQRRTQTLAADEMFQCLNQQEQGILAGYLDRIIAGFKATLGSEQPEFPGHGPHATHCFRGHHRGIGREEFMQHKLKAIQNYASVYEGFTAHYNTTPPWDIGKPQAPFLTVADQIQSPVLDVGCGTGSTALFFAAKGHEVTGIDFVDSAIRQARAKAVKQGIAVNFLVKDAMTLLDWDESFASVIDSGLFHIYSGQDQAQERADYVRGLAHVLKPGGRLFLLSFTDEAPEGGVSERELYEIFADGWEIEAIKPVLGEINPAFLAKHPGAYPEGGSRMWFAVIRRVGTQF